GEEDTDFTSFAVPAALGGVTAVAFSPDRRLLLVARARGAVHILDAATGAEVGLLNENVPLTATPAFSPDGRILAMACGQEEGTAHTVSLWELASGKKRWSMPVSAAVTALAFSPSGKVLATGHRDGAGLLWDVTGQATTSTGARAGFERLWADLIGDDAERAY